MAIVPLSSGGQVNDDGTDDPTFTEANVQPTKKVMTMVVPGKRCSQRAVLPLWRSSLWSISKDGTSVGPTKSGGEERRIAKPKLLAVKVASQVSKTVYKYMNMHELLGL